MDYKEQVQTIYDYIKRSEEQQKYAYAYEIYLLTGLEETALISRTSGSTTFLQDIEKAIEKAKQSNAMIRVEVFGGKSPNSKKLNEYLLNVSGLLHQPKEVMPPEQLEVLIEKAVEKQNKQSQDRPTDFDTLLGLFSGENPQVKSKLDGLFGVFNAMSGNNKDAERIAYQKQLDDFKYETRYNMLHEKYETLRSENAGLKVEKEKYTNENRELLKEKTDLGHRLAGYTPNELMKRVAVGAVANIGSRLLSNSSKTAELLGLTPQELKGALGIVDEVGTETPGMIPETGVEIAEVGTVKTPEEEKKSSIIKNISDALMTWELQDVAKIANIVGLCLDKPELIDGTLTFLHQAINKQEQAISETQQIEELEPKKL